VLAEEQPFGRRTRRRQQTHQSILDAAHRLFAERGYEHTKLIDIADAADLHLQTLYRHFNCKHELVTANTQVIRSWVQGDDQFDLVGEACSTVDFIAERFAPLMVGE